MVPKSSVSRGALLRHARVQPRPARRVRRGRAYGAPGAPPARRDGAPLWAGLRIRCGCSVGAVVFSSSEIIRQLDKPWLRAANSNSVNFARSIL